LSGTLSVNVNEATFRVNAEKHQSSKALLSAPASSVT
jgi:hypothetical protein